MTNVYIRDEIELKILEIAKAENKILIAADKKPDISKSAIIQRIVYAYFEGEKQK